MQGNHATASINRPADRGALQSSDLPHELVALVSSGIPDTPAARREQLAVLDSHIEWLQDAEKQQNHDVALRDKSMDARQQQLSGLEHSISKERHSAVSTAALQLLSRKQSQVSGDLASLQQLSRKLYQVARLLTQLIEDNRSQSEARSQIIWSQQRQLEARQKRNRLKQIEGDEVAQRLLITRLETQRLRSQIEVLQEQQQALDQLRRSQEQVLACKLRVEELRQAVAGQLATAVISSAEGAGISIDGGAAADSSQAGGGVQEPSCAALPDMGASPEQSNCACHGGCGQTAAPACMPQPSCGAPPTESAAVAARPQPCQETLVWAGSLEAEGANHGRCQLHQSEIRQQDVRKACEMATPCFKVSPEYTASSPDSVLALI